MFLALAVLCSAVVGCGPKRATIHARPASQLTGISPPTYRADLLAMATPPEGWTAEPIKASGRHIHQVWISPSGRTAYGILYFTLPWPVGQDIALQGFLNEMKKTEGVATLVQKKNDPNLPGLRFVAEGGLYFVRGNMIVDGWRGWTIYATTKVKQDVDEKELEFAEAARESTRVGSELAPGNSATRPSGTTQPVGSNASLR